MPSFIRHPKDFWIGALFLFFGLVAVIVARDYPMGTAGRMGPAYFPTMLGSLLILIGAVSVIRAFLHDGEPVGKFYMKEVFLVLTGVVLFGLLMRGAGLVPAIVVLLMLSAYASQKFRWREALLLSAGLTVFAIIVFVKLLGLPMPAFGPWLGF
jgi:hypothetical protein